MKTTTKHNPFVQITVRSSEASRVEALLRIPGDPAAAERLCAAAVAMCCAERLTLQTRNERAQYTAAVANYYAARSAYGTFGEAETVDGNW